MTPEELLEALEDAGYTLLLRGGKLVYEYEGPGSPNPEIAGPLLQALKAQGSKVASHIRYLYDPRDDIQEDTTLWQSVLIIARRRNRDVYIVLHGLRCMGARLVLEKERLRLEPRIHRGENPQIYEFDSLEDYQKLRDEFLVPIEREVADIFREAAKGHGSGGEG